MGLLGPIARNVLLAGAAFDGFDQPTAAAGTVQRLAKLLQRLVEQEVGWDQALLAGHDHSPKFIVELIGVGLEPRDIGICVVACRNLMLGIEEARSVEVGAHILDDHVGRVSPAADGNVAIRLHEAFKCIRVGTPDDFDAGANRVRQRGNVDCIGPCEVATERLCKPLLPDARTVGELRTKGDMLALVDSQ